MSTPQKVEQARLDLDDALAGYKLALRARRVSENQGRSVAITVMAHLEAGVVVANCLELLELAVIIHADGLVEGACAHCGALPGSLLVAE